MNDFGTVLLAVVPVFCIALAGIAMRRLNWLTEEADKSLLRLTVNLLSPALIFDSILHNETLKHGGTMVLAPLVGFGTVALGMWMAGASAKGLKLGDAKVIGTFAYCVGIYNYGYVPVPLAKTLFPAFPDTMGVLFAHNLGVEIAFWTVGLTVLGATSGGNWRNLLSGPVVAIFAALILNFTGLDVFIPNFILKTAQLLGQCAVPIGLILIGATIADHLHEFHSARGWRVILFSCLLRLGLLPLLFLLLAKYLPCSVELKRVILLQAAMPAATFPIVIVRHYGGEPSTALRIVISTSVVSLITIPLWIRFGMQFLGLN